MKNKFTVWMMAILVAALLAGCSSDKTPGPGPGPGEGSGVQNWLVDDLSKMYLWNGDVKAKTINYKETDYKKFFNSLLSTNREDGRYHGTKNAYFYSEIFEQTAGANAPMLAGTFYNSLGANYALVNIYFVEVGKFAQGIALLIKSIVKGSPLWEEGFRRGDYILETNDNRINISATGVVSGVELFLSPVLQPKGSVKLLWGHPTDNGKTLNVDLPDGSTAILHIADFVFERPYVSPAAVEENPVHRSGVVTSGGGKKVGYIAYTGFERGENGYYDDKLKEAVREIKSQGATEMVLDLRYNGGGYMTSCQLLTSMILPESEAGKNLLRMTYNDELVAENAAKYNQWLPILSREQMKDPIYGSSEGEFLGMTKLYVIVSSETASASEALIHAIKGLDIPVYIIGLNTEGKNVGMTQRLSDDVKTKYDFAGKSYESWPITLYIKDAKEQKYTAAGFAPDYVFDELNLFEENYIVAMKELGDPKEELLALALHHIDSGSFPAKSFSRSNLPDVRVESPIKMPKRIDGIRIGAHDYPVE